MLKPLNKETALDAITEELELPLVLLSNPDTRVQLEMIRRIGAALMSTNLTFRDLAERVTAPRAPTVPLSDGVPMPTTPRWPTSGILVGGNVAVAMPVRPITAETVLSNKELQRLGGYRTAPVRDGLGPEAGAPASLADPAVMDFVEAELRSYSYRTTPAPSFGRYGYGPVPDTCETVQGESDEAAGQRLALWAMAKSGQPFWEDPATGKGYLPGVEVPGQGKIQPDGTLGPLPAEG